MNGCVSSANAPAALLSETLLQAGVTPGSVVDREIIAEQTQLRMGQLDVGQLPICFGRIDRDNTPSEQGLPGEVFYIGRIGRVGRRRRIRWSSTGARPSPNRSTAPRAATRWVWPGGATSLAPGPTSTAIEDEVFTPDALPASTDVEMVGAGALLAALERDRTGRMHDIVATVQREQDEIIRGSMHGVLVVQGGPGTGKTAVALHRAAYLLYTHRFPLERQGVLVVGPNPLFLQLHRPGAAVAR